MAVASQHLYIPYPFPFDTTTAGYSQFLGKTVSKMIYNQSINQKVNLYSVSSIKNSQMHYLHISTLNQPCLKSTLELFPGNGYTVC